MKEKKNDNNEMKSENYSLFILSTMTSAIYAILSVMLFLEKGFMQSKMYMYILLCALFAISAMTYYKLYKKEK